MFFELRQYHTRPGCREKWVRFMEEEIIPYQESKGMTIMATWVGQDDDDLYVWIRQFESEEDCERLYTAVYDSDHWKQRIAPKIPDMLDLERAEITRLDPAATVLPSQHFKELIK